MGKARIVSGGTDGSYTVEVLHNRERIDDEIERIEKDLAELDPNLAAAKEVLEYAELEVAEAKMYADALIDQFEEEGAIPPVDLARLVQLHNAFRASSGLGALVAVDKLNAAAQEHANDLAANNMGSHTGSNGSTPASRIKGAGYTGAAGENVAWGQKPPEENPVEAWKNSPGHRSNMLRPEWQHIGVGYACRPDGYRHFWVAVFGDGAAASAQTPAAPSNCVGEEQDVPELIQEAIEALAEKSRNRDIAELDVTLLTATQVSFKDRKKELQSIPPDPTQQAWCADYTEGLAGEAGTAEIPGEGNTRVIIRPGYDGRADFEPNRDGQLFHRRGMTGAQAYFNAAILPGWQRWKPTYRVGVISNIDTDSDTCTVTLDSETSSAQSLNVNQPGALTGVPVEYMGCNAEAFENGDRVLVEFVGRSWSSPKVIGFESNPKECEDWPAFFDVVLTQNTGPQIDEEYFRDSVWVEIWSTCCGDAWRSGVFSSGVTKAQTRLRSLVVTGTVGLGPGMESDFGNPSSADPVFLYSVKDTVIFGPLGTVGTSSFTIDPAPATWAISTGANFFVRRTDYSVHEALTYDAWNHCGGDCTWNPGSSRTSTAVFGITWYNGGTPPGPGWGSTQTDTVRYDQADYGTVAAWSQDLVTWLVGNTTLPAQSVLTIDGSVKTYDLDYEGSTTTSSSIRVRYVLPES